MRFKQIIETTTAGSVATVAQPMMTQTLESIDVPGLKPVQQVMKGKATKKGPYANSITESKVKELTMDLKELTTAEFQKKYGKTKTEIKASMTAVNEDDLAEQDLIVIPGQGRLRKTGFVMHDMDQGEHEGHTLKNSLHTIIRVATDLDKRLSVQSEFPEWVSEKIGATKSMMVTVMDYLISSQEMQHDPDDMNEGSERVDSLVTDALRVMKGPEVSDAVLALKRVLGDRAYNERRGFYSFYVDQIVDMYGQQGVEEGRVAQLPTQGADYSKYDTDHLKMMLRPGILHRDEARFKALIRKELQKREQQGVAEGEIDTSRMNKQHQDFYNTNPNFKRNDREATSVGGRLATKVTPKTAQVTKKPMTPFESIDNAWDAAKKKVSEGLRK